MASQISTETANRLGAANAAVRLGDKLYVAEYATNASNARHHFAGEVAGISGEVVRLDGYDFVYEESLGSFTRKPFRAERIVHLGSAMIFYVLPAHCSLGRLRHERHGNELIITDGGSFRLVDTRYSGR